MKSIKVLISLFILTSVTASNDPLFLDQWHLENTGQTIVEDTGSLTSKSLPGVKGKDIDFYDVDSQKKLPSSKKVIVAVLDTGVDTTHPDLKGKLWVDERVEDCRQDNPPLGCSGFNMIKRNRNVQDEGGHGTHVAGIIAAKANNKLGVRGAASSHVVIMPIKVLDNNSTAYRHPERKMLMSDIFAQGIAHAISLGADVINMSLGWPKVVEGELFKKALELAQEKNVPIIVAAGNNNKKITTFPCNYKEVICVGAYTNTGVLSQQSNFGSNVDISAPGTSILSTHPLNLESKITRIQGYEKKTGTSQAAPLVSAIVADMKLMYPNITIDEIKARLFNASKQDDGVDGKYTLFGRVSMKKALLERPSVFVAPIFKDIQEVTFSKDSGDFSIDIPIKSYVGEANNIEILVESNLKGANLNQKSFSFSHLEKGEEKNLKIKGKITDFLQDTDFDLFLTIKTTGFEKKTRLSLIFSRDLSKEKDLKRFELEDMLGRDVIEEALPINKLKMNLVQDYTADSSYPEMFSFEKKEEGLSLQLLRFSQKRFKSKRLNIQNGLDISGIYKHDFNFDGESDYLISLIYKEGKKNYYAFYYLNNDLQPLLGKNSLWKIEPKDFIKLPSEKVYDEKISNTENEREGIDDKLNWLKVKSSQLGEILVPSVFGIGSTPSKDNSNDFLDRKPKELKEFHLFYYNPVLDEDGVQGEVRIIDSFDFYSDIQERFRLNSNIAIQLERPLKQNHVDRSQGRVNLPISIGNGQIKDFYLVELKQADSYQINKTEFQPRALSNNYLASMNEAENLSNSGYSSYILPIDKERLRVAIFDEKLNFVEERNISTGDWSDLIFRYISGYKDEGDFVHFIFSRYYIHMYADNEVHQKLRINLDSTIKEESFNESMYPSLSMVKGKARPSLFIDGTKIYGDRIYSMVKVDDQFLRPRIFSTRISNHCLQFNKPLKIEGRLSYAMLCGKSGEQAYLQAIPLVY